MSSTPPLIAPAVNIQPVLDRLGVRSMLGMPFAGPLGFIPSVVPVVLVQGIEQQVSIQWPLGAQGTGTGTTSPYMGVTATAPAGGTTFIAYLLGAGVWDVLLELSAGEASRWQIAMSETGGTTQYPNQTISIAAGAYKWGPYRLTSKGQLNIQPTNLNTGSAGIVYAVNGWVRFIGAS